MKNKIICLTDYKNRFGNKWNAVPYRSGMDKNLLLKYFSEIGIEIEFRKFSDMAINPEELKNNVYLYSSSEDIGAHYKSFIEDIVLSLEQSGAEVIPEFKFLRAHNNKVFMELLRKSSLNEMNIPASSFYGALEEVDFGKINYPVVFKNAAGSMSSGVALAKNSSELKSIIKKSCRTPGIKEDFIDYIRSKKREGYVRESFYRSKFILQEFIHGLSYDFKLLIYGNRFYVFRRPVRKNDFRASGSGHKNYIYGSGVEYPEGIFDFGLKIFEKLQAPQLSLDIAYDGKKFYLLEFQAVYFGTVGVEKSDGYYTRDGNQWLFKSEKLEIEKVYAESVFSFLKNHI